MARETFLRAGAPFATSESVNQQRIKAVLGPTNTGKTHLAIERMCGHSSGVIGFPLRLLAREVYDRLCAIKGPASVALVTGEERIVPPKARYFCCTVEAMPDFASRTGPCSGAPQDNGLSEAPAFVAIDEAQLGSDPERGHIFTDRLLHARGREETMILGSATLAPLVRALVGHVEMIERPRFSTLSHVGPVKLSRLPARSAVVGFSAEEVYAAAEMLRRLRGGAAVVMGALSPETRNKQVELFQSGEVDTLVATDAIGMGLNLDLAHVAFASLSKFDGRRKRRLLPSEMAQIAGRAGRHQRDGTFGTLAGGIEQGASENALTDDEIYALEEHRFAPLKTLYWREGDPRFDSLGALIADLEAPPKREGLAPAPESIDLKVLKKLAAEPFADQIRGAGAVRRFWDVCMLPDFSQIGADNHARFIARLWQDLGEGYLGADFVAARIARLDQPSGDIANLQGKIAATRIWSYICQRPDWVLAREEMAERARAVEARLSDALHARLTEKFVNRRTRVLMRSLGENTAQLPVTLDSDGLVSVEGETIGQLRGLRFVVDPKAAHAEHKMLLAAGEKSLPALVAQRVDQLLAGSLDALSLHSGSIVWDDEALAELAFSPDFGAPQLRFARELAVLPAVHRARFEQAIRTWLEAQLEPLAPLRELARASRDPQTGSQARALLLAVIDGCGVVARKQAGLQHLPKEMRPFLRRLGVVFGALDIFVPALLKPKARHVLHTCGIDPRALNEAMVPVIANRAKMPAGYRPAGDQAIRVDCGEKILRAAFEARTGARGRRFPIDCALGVSIGLEKGNLIRLLGAAGFNYRPARALEEAAHGPVAPDLFGWHTVRSKPGAQRKSRGTKNARRKGGRAKPQGSQGAGAFDSLAELLR